MRFFQLLCLTQHSKTISQAWGSLSGRGVVGKRDFFALLRGDCLLRRRAASPRPSRFIGGGRTPLGKVLKPPGREEIGHAASSRHARRDDPASSCRCAWLGGIQPVSEHCPLLSCSSLQGSALDKQSRRKLLMFLTLAWIHTA